MSLSRLILSSCHKANLTRGAARIQAPASSFGVRGLATNKDDKKDDKSTHYGIADLTDVVSETHELTKTESRRIITSILDAIVEATANKKKVSLTNFGFFESTHAKAREGRNPNTGDVLKIAAKERVKFKAFSSFKTAVNKK